MVPLAIREISKNISNYGYSGKFAVCIFLDWKLPDSGCGAIFSGICLIGVCIFTADFSECVKS